MTDIRPLKGDNDQKDKVKPGKRKAETDENNPRGPASSSQARGSAFGQGTFQEQSRPETASAPAKQTVIRCKFHNGVLVNRVSRDFMRSRLFCSPKARLINSFYS